MTILNHIGLKYTRKLCYNRTFEKKMSTLLYNNNNKFSDFM